MSHRLQVLIPEDLDMQLRKAAQRNRVSKGEWVRRALRQSVIPAKTGKASDPVARLALASLRDGANLIPEGSFPARGTLLAPDHSFLFTVDWDSFFTLFYGPRAFVARVAAGLNLEGFFATPNTEHAWYNYSFGCATVTLSPEHWQTV